MVFYSRFDWDAPIVELLEEMNLIVFILELWEHLHTISKIVDQIQKCFTISIKEYFIIDFLALMHTTKHFIEERPWNQH